MTMTDDMFGSTVERRIEAAPKDSGVKPVAPLNRYEWDAPFLHDDDRVWIDDGYGVWAVYPQSHTKARVYQEIYTRWPEKRAVDAGRLRFYLESRRG